MDSCENCRFWRGGKVYSQCKRKPPVAVFQVAFNGYGAATHYDTLWPNTVPSDWCGEHQSREAKAVEGVNGELLAAARDVLAERERQKVVEGWTHEHDDKHANGEMAQAAACYALTRPAKSIDNRPLWPWSPLWWKPKDRRHDLVRAGALIIAEIERLDRAEEASR